MFDNVSRNAVEAKIRLVLPKLTKTTLSIRVPHPAIVQLTFFITHLRIVIIKQISVK